MFESHYEAAFDVLNGIAPWGKEVYSIPMQLLTPKFVGKLPSDAVFLAKIDGVLEASLKADRERYLLRFGDCTFEGFGVSGTFPVGGPDVVCFTPRIASLKDKEYVVLDVIGMASIPDKTTYVGDINEGTDPSDLARDAENLRVETEAFEAMTS